MNVFDFGFVILQFSKKKLTAVVYMCQQSQYMGDENWDVIPFILTIFLCFLLSALHCPLLKMGLSSLIYINMCSSQPEYSSVFVR